MSENRVELVQIQHDRFTLNWREVDGTIDYPRYSALRERFLHLLNLLISALADVGKSASINICEVTYVNPIEGSEPGTFGDPATVINLLQRPTSTFLPPPEIVQLNARWLISDANNGNDANPVGHLYLAVHPGLKPPKNTPIYLANVVARVIPSDSTLDTAFDALDRAHKWVVKGFKDVTTANMHREWGLKEDQA